MQSLWRTLERRTLAANPYWSYCCDRYLAPNGEASDYYYVHTPGSVLAVPLFDAQTVLMVRQYRYLNGRTSLEFPGGGCKAGRTPLACAQDELQEETGYRAAHWQELGGFNPCKGLTDEWCSVYLCRDLHAAPLANSDPFEITAAEVVTMASIPERIRGGDIWCGMTIAAWYLAGASL
ncbi:NUDIX domain-containing protein [Gloeobacter kilaueensis]|nr:NUDIX hydrolase [Gloeobacter kilaueensis]